jgi:hypothetical protein
MLSLGVISTVVVAVASTVAAKEQPALSTCTLQPKRRYIEAILIIHVAAQDYFDYSMSLADSRYDASYGYVWYNDNGPWSTRFTAWYIPGLLHRNKGDDVANAQKALRNLYDICPDIVWLDHVLTKPVSTFK